MHLLGETRVDMTRIDKAALPLAKNCLFQSSDVDEARAIVARKFCDHRLEQVTAKGHFDAVHNRVEGLTTSLNIIRYGADVKIEPGELGTFYLIQIPLAGHAQINNSDGDVDSGPGLGSVLNPHRHTSMRWREGCSQLLLQIDAACLNRIAERLVGRTLNQPVTFQTAVNQNAADVRRWVHKLRTCCSLAEKNAIYDQGNLHTQVLVEEQLIENFLFCQPNDISTLIAEGCFHATNVHVKRAVQYIRDNLGEPMMIGKIAEMLQISTRSLQLGFKAELGQTPQQFLRETRLREARHLLANASSDERIGDICERVGFAHFGRFSVDYKQRYGESPHETLQKQRIGAATTRQAI